jgi:hypothetical protein
VTSAGQVPPRNLSTPGKVFRRAAGSRQFWTTLIAILLVTALLPTPAKAPVAMVLSGVLLVPAMQRAQVWPMGRTQGEDLAPPDGPIQFAGFIWCSDRARWSQVRIVIDGPELRSAPYWRLRTPPPTVLTLTAAEPVSARISSRHDLPLKPGRMRILDYRLGDGTALRVAAELSIADEVTAAIRRGAG